MKPSECPKAQGKVYCRQCGHFKEISLMPYAVWWECLCGPVCEDSALQHTHRPADPFHKNAKNDCADFQPIQPRVSWLTRLWKAIRQ